MSDRRPVDRNAQRVARALSKRRPGGYQQTLESLLDLRDRTRDDVYFELTARWPDDATVTWVAWGLDTALEHITNLEHPAAQPGDDEDAQWTQMEFDTQAQRDAWIDANAAQRRNWGSAPGGSILPDGRRMSVFGNTVSVTQPDPKVADFYAGMSAATNAGFTVRDPSGAVITAVALDRDRARELAAEIEPWTVEEWDDHERWTAQRDADENLRERATAAGRDLDDAKVTIRAAWASGLTNQQIREHPLLADLHLWDSVIDQVAVTATVDDIQALPHIDFDAPQRLESFTHFQVGDDTNPDRVEVMSWADALAAADRMGETQIIGVTWDARQVLGLDGVPVNPQR